MYRSKDRRTPALFPELFPLGGSLRPGNRWMTLADMIPWEELEEMYRGYFAVGRGRPAEDSRLICGLLTVKHITGDSDEKVIERFLESPYVQWFCGVDTNYLWIAEATLRFTGAVRPRGGKERRKRNSTISEGRKSP